MFNNNVQSISSKQIGLRKHFFNYQIKHYISYIFIFNSKFAASSGGSVIILIFNEFGLTEFLSSLAFYL